MRLLERATRHYQTPRPYQPRHAQEFVLEATRAEREQLVEWCLEHGGELRVRAGSSWGVRCRTSVLTYTEAMATRFEALLAAYQPAPVIATTTPYPRVDSLAAWAIAEVADMKARAKAEQAASEPLS